MDYDTFIDGKSQLGGNFGFKPTFVPDFLFDFQKDLLKWGIEKGKFAVFADCGLGKTAMQLVWCQNIVEKTNGNVLILTPLAVGSQTVREAAKFGIEVGRSHDGKPNGKITVTNYEKLHLFNAADFVAVACDESSIIKHATGATQKAVTRFMLKLKYRSLWTATAAPNDFTELGTSSEALGNLNNSEMLTRFFKQMDAKTTDQYEKKINNLEKQANHFGKVSFRVSQAINGWRLKGHAHDHFWKWVCSWARACRKPSDVGFSDAGYDLPDLIEREHIVKPTTPPDGMLFTMPAFGLKEERDERRRTLKERCKLVADLVAHDKPAVVWCHMNSEGDYLEKIIPNSIQVSGALDDEEKELAYEKFLNQDNRVLILKPKIGAWGLNWQFCNHVVTFASHSYEQYYQSIRRCWRFGQKLPVTVDIIASEGEQRVRDNMSRKAAQADKMFAELVKQMNHAMTVERKKKNLIVSAPSWIN
jgi:Helicase conserved C-terminal domain